jgi:hypothetical protein
LNRKLDIAKVEAALKRAAEQGINGPPELRAGRFQPAPAQSRIVKPIQPPLASNNK